ncbi:MAG: type IV pilus assembly protein PilM, partial [Candidatus Hydrogenedentes bacterium]|nr:type IV pilus assembly protein PilM [Candidatus Hydrogenedentota bacterium]
MNLGNFTKPKKVIGIDLGNHSVKAIQASKSGRKIYIEEIGYSDIDLELFNADPVKAQTTAIELALKGMEKNKSLIVCGLPGNTAVVRYPKINVKEGEKIEDVVLKEAGQYIPFDLNDVYISSDIIEGEPTKKANQIQIILVASKKDVINSRLNVLGQADLQCSVFDLDSIAVYNAIKVSRLMKPGESLAIFDIGFTSSSIHFVRDFRSVFIRDLGWGGKDMIDAIVKETHQEFRQAEAMLMDSAKEIISKPEAPLAEEVKEYETEEEIIAEEVEEVIVEEPIPHEDSFEEEYGFRDTIPSTKAIGGREKSIREVLLPSMSRMISEVKRSFDFYEHQLYEKPVERIIVCGGVSCYPLIGETLVHELNVDTVEVADFANENFSFSNSNTIKQFKEHSAKFSVALGLVARGLEEI